MALLVFLGEDDFRKREALLELKARVGPPEFADPNISILDGDHIAFDELVQMASSVPFLSSERLIIISGLLDRFEAKRVHGRKGRARRGATSELGQWTRFHSYLQVDFPPTTTIVLVDGIISPSNPLLASVQEFAEVRHFRPLSREQVQEWIRARVMLGGDAISPNAVVLLQQLLGNDLWNVSQELEKLMLYTQGSRRVEVDDVRLLVYAERATNVFRFVDAVFDRKFGVAMESLHGLLDDGATASYLLGMLGRQVRLLFQAQEALSQGLTQEQVGSRVGLTSEFPLRLLIDQAKRQDPSGLLDFHQALLEADLALKRGIMTEATALELVVGHLSGIGTRIPLDH